MRWMFTTTIYPRISLRRAALRYCRPRLGRDPGRLARREPVRVRAARLPDRRLPPRARALGGGRHADPARVGAWWRRQPHAVLLATGRAFDVLEVPAHLGLQVLAWPRARTPACSAPDRLQVRGPVAVDADRPLDVPRAARRPAAPGARRQPRRGAPRRRLVDAGAADAACRRAGCAGSVSPDEVAWRLPDSYALQAPAGRRGVGAAAVRAAPPPALQHPAGGLRGPPARTPATGRRRGR